MGSPFSPGFWDKHGWGYAVSVITRHEPGDPRGFGWDGGYGTSCYWDPETGLIGAADDGLAHRARGVHGLLVMERALSR